jgi:ABC-type Fe3+ transport system permease subunit
MVFAALVAGTTGLALATLWLGLAPGDATPAAWRSLLVDPVLVDRLSAGLGVTLAGGILAGVLGLLLAFAAHRSRHPLRGLLVLCAAAPIVLPPHLLGLLIDDAAGRWPGAALAALVDHPIRLLVAAYGLHYAPVVFWVVLMRLDRRDPSPVETARTLGVGNRTAWYWLTLPQIAPAVSLGLAIVALRMLGDGLTPAVLGVDGVLAVGAFDPVAGTGTIRPEAILVTALCGLLVALAWRSLATGAPLPGTNRRRIPSPLAYLALPVAALVGLLPLGWLLAGAVGTPAAALLETLRQTFPATLALGGLTGLVVLVLGGLAALLSRRSGTGARLARRLLPLWLAVPGLGLALAVESLLADASLPGPALALLGAAIATGLPLVPLAPLFASRLHLSPGREVADFSRCLGATPGWAAARLLLPGTARLLIALGLIGAALALVDANTLLYLSQSGVDTLGTRSLDSLSGTPDARLGPAQWLGAALAAILLGGAGLLLRERQPRRAPRTTLPDGLTA